MVEIDSMMLRRTDDPLGEYRRIILYQREGPLHSVWEATGYLSRPDFAFVKRRQLKIGNRTDMQKFFAETAQSLRDEGFSVCEPDLSAPGTSTVES